MSKTQAGKMTQEEFLEAEHSNVSFSGSCNTMGTAQHMASDGKKPGMRCKASGDFPAVDSRRRVMAHLTGRRIC